MTLAHTWKRLRATLTPKILWWGLVGFGFFLRVRLYALNRSFWGDEASLAVNIVNRSFAGLAQLLDFYQAAPIGFLYIEKVSILLLGNQDYILRLFPLIAGLAAVYLIFLIAREHFGAAGMFALAMFSTSWWLVYYSSELKQYVSDITMALLLVHLAGKCFKADRGRNGFLMLGAVGSITIWISHPSVFIMVGIGLALATEKALRKDFAPWTWILGIGLAWLVSFGLAYLVSFQHIVSDGYLITYWRKAYAPFPPWSDKGWYLNTLNSFVFFAFHRGDYAMVIITLVLSVAGAVSLILRDRKSALLLVSPFLVVTVISMLQRYPLKNRFMLFLIPLVFLLMAESVRLTHDLLSRWRPRFATAISAGLALAVLWLFVPITIEKASSNSTDNIRPVIQYVAENIQPGDTLYVFHLTEPVFLYYAPFYGLEAHSPTITGTFHANSRKAYRSYKDDVFELIGVERVWFLFSEITDCIDCPAEDTQGYYLQILDQYGTRMDTFDGTGANAFLYDLSQ